MNPEEEKNLKNSFNHIMNDDMNRSTQWGYPLEDLGPTPEDVEVEGTVRDLFKNTQRADASDVSVSVKHGLVRLSGTVKTQEERDYLISVVKLIHGVGAVDSELIVKTHDGILPTDIGRH